MTIDGSFGAGAGVACGAGGGIRGNGMGVSCGSVIGPGSTNGGGDVAPGCAGGV
jgi:hypothetical protein